MGTIRRIQGSVIHRQIHPLQSLKIILLKTTNTIPNALFNKMRKSFTACLEFVGDQNPSFPSAGHFLSNFTVLYDYFANDK